MPENAVARHVHGDLPSMLIGGISALLLQTLHPLVMAGVADHSRYREDPIGRLRRTGTFIEATTFGTVEEAEEAIESVRRVHNTITGRSPDGRRYRAGDPALITWVHVAETVSFLAAACRYGRRPLSATELDTYHEEMAEVGLRLGAKWVPRTAAEAEAYMARMRPHLYAGRQAREARDFLLRGVARRPQDRALYTLLAAAAVGLLPTWARQKLGLPTPPLVDACMVRPLAWGACQGIRWLVRTEPPPTLNGV